MWRWWWWWWWWWTCWWGWGWLWWLYKTSHNTVITTISELFESNHVMRHHMMSCRWSSLQNTHPSIIQPSMYHPYLSIHLLIHLSIHPPYSSIHLLIHLYPPWGPWTFCPATAAPAQRWGEPRGPTSRTAPSPAQTQTCMGMDRWDGWDGWNGWMDGWHRWMIWMDGVLDR